MQSFLWWQLHHIALWLVLVIPPAVRLTMLDTGTAVPQRVLVALATRLGPDFRSSPVAPLRHFAPSRHGTHAEIQHANKMPSAELVMKRHAKQCIQKHAVLYRTAFFVKTGCHSAGSGTFEV